MSRNIRTKEDAAIIRDTNREHLKDVIRSSDQDSARKSIHSQDHSSLIKEEGHVNAEVSEHLSKSSKGHSLQQPELYRTETAEPAASKYSETPEEAAQKRMSASYQAERYQHYTHENSVKKEARYGTVEGKTGEGKIIGGAAGNAVLKPENRIIKDSKVGVAGRSSVKASVQESQSNIIKPGIDLAGSSSNSVPNNYGKKNGSNGFLRNAGRIAERKVLLGNQSSEDLSQRAAAQAKNYGYKAGKYALLASSRAVRSANVHLLKHKDKAKIEKQRSMKRHSVPLLSPANTIKEKVGTLAEDFQGSDDLGIRTITASKDAIFKAKRTHRMASSAGRAFKGTAKATAKGVKKAAQAAKSIIRKSTTAIKSFFSNPLVMKVSLIAGLIVLLIALLITAASSITSIFPVISLKSEDKEIAKTYDYVTELDANLTNEIRNISGDGIDEYHFYINGSSVSRNDIMIYTNADYMLMYLDCKYKDYAFDNPILGAFGGTSVKEEIAMIHHTLHSYETNVWEEEIEHESDNKDGTTDSWTEIIHHMDVNVHTGSFESYLTDNLDTLLTDDQKELYDVLKEIGVYTARKELGNPFVDKSEYSLQERWGWKFQNDSVIHNDGIDIPKGFGTEVCCVKSGTVSEIGTTGSYGTYVRIKSGKSEVLYGGLSSVNVSDGDTITIGAVIGKASVLHLEYFIENGFNTNPAFYLEGYSGYLSDTGLGFMGDSMPGLESFSGSKRAALARAFPNGIPTSEAAMAQYMVTISVPCLNKSGQRVNRRVTCNPNIVSEVQEIFEEMADIGFIAYDVSCYSYRSKNNNSGKKSLSSHSYGLAFDINVNENAQYLIKNGRYVLNTGSLYQPGSNPYSITQDVANIWIRHGFAWGGAWKSQKDYMHFSLTGD